MLTDGERKRARMKGLITVYKNCMQECLEAEARSLFSIRAYNQLEATRVRLVRALQEAGVEPEDFIKQIEQEVIDAHGAAKADSRPGS